MAKATNMKYDPTSDARMLALQQRPTMTDKRARATGGRAIDLSGVPQEGQTPSPIEPVGPPVEAPGTHPADPGASTGDVWGGPPPLKPPGFLTPEIEQQVTLQNEKNAIKQERTADLAEGRARGEEIFGNDALGRVGTDASPEMQDIIARRKAMLSGYTPEELEAQKSIYTTPAQQALQGQVRAMRGAQASAGVRGSAASAQESQIRGQFAKEQAQLGQAQFLADADARRQALTGYQAAVQGSEADRLQREQYNIDQKNKELMGILTTELGYGQLGTADRYNTSMSQAAIEFGARI
jgi:hypothetical protein